ncbi:MAG: hypothetical protein C5B60_02405 [Chloroflexi bacterium]|nr:MAG: hypothetical protein C5B60_02405 [Chloroflexota bacterium]
MAEPILGPNDKLNVTIEGQNAQWWNEFLTFLDNHCVHRLARPVIDACTGAAAKLANGAGAGETLPGSAQENAGLGAPRRSGRPVMREAADN